MTVVDFLPYIVAIGGLLAFVHVMVRKNREARVAAANRLPIELLDHSESAELVSAAVRRVFPDRDANTVRDVLVRFRFAFNQLGGFVLRPEAQEVEAVAKRVFGPNGSESVLRELNEYGRREHELEPNRVRLAIIKASQGNSKRISEFVSSAKSDLRNVIIPMEEPHSFAVQDHLNRDNIERTRAANDADLRQYVAWLLENA